MLRITSLLLLLASFGLVVNAQTTQDSLQSLYSDYYQNLTKLSRADSLQLDSIQVLTQRLQAIDLDYQNQVAIINSNLDEINLITIRDIINDSIQVVRSIKRINYTSSFISDLDVSINALDLTNKLTLYLEKTGNLNSATNTELGFTLFDEVERVLGQTVLKKDKVNKIQKSKFLRIVNDIINNPIVTSISSTIPVVSSIESIVRLFTNVSLRGDDISVEELIQLKSSLKNYIRHYERLDSISHMFRSDIRTLNLRTEGLSNLAKIFTIERLNSIDPNWRNNFNPDTASLTHIVEQFYYPERVGTIITNIQEGQNKGQWDRLLTDRRVSYPTYAINQARLFYDEVKSLRNDYIKVFNKYQKGLESALGRSQAEIGKVVQATKVINELRVLKDDALASFEKSLRLTTLQRAFDNLSSYQ